MARQKVIDYIRGLLQKGYDISAIKNTMLKYGYTNKDIDEAVNQIYSPTVRHELHFSKTAIIVIVFIVIAISGAAFFIFQNQKAPEQLLDLTFQPVKTTARAGDSISFIKEISNLGSSKRYDIFIRQELVDAKTSKIIAQQSETRAIETTGSTQTSMLIPQTAKPGEYILRVVAEYHGKYANATLPVAVLSGEAAQKETCFDGVKNQNEDETDCGGDCSPCKAGISDCNDSDPCTDDRNEDGNCVNLPITPCCGNGICEERENCASDCKEPATQETLDQIRETAKSNPDKAMQKCGLIDVPDLKDTCIKNVGEVQSSRGYCAEIASSKIKDECYSNIAKSSNDKSVCREITNDGIRDSCYSYFFVPPNKDYSVCEKLVNKDLQQSCDRLRQLFEISQKVENNG